MKLLTKWFFCLPLFFCACGGGGGDDHNPALSTNACGTIGLPAKIVNGTACTGLSSSPVVRLALITPDGKEGLCTGTMVTGDAVLTAAHCFIFNPVRVLVLVGESLATSDVFEASRVNIHPGFTGSGSVLVNDVAVVHLRRSPGLPTMAIQTSNSPDSGDVVAIYGYGTDENGNFDFQELKSGEMRVDSVSEHHILAVYEGEGSNTCQGDSGGPLVSTVTGAPAIAGLTSSGTEQGCGPGDNSLFTNIRDPNVESFLHQVVPNAAFR